MIIQAITITGLFLLGAALGSFAVASVWRLRARQLAEDKADGEWYDHREYNRLKPLLDKKMLSDRSICLGCKYQLRWYDMVPVASWLVLLGRCRKCRAPIGRLEVITEITLGLLFALSFGLWHISHDVSNPYLYVLWLASLVGLVILFIYDLKWYLLPSRINYAVIGLGVIYATIVVAASSDPTFTLGSVMIGVFLLSGIYGLLYLFSKGQWVGLGDVILGAGLALLLADWRLAFLVLFLANLIGTLIVVPGIVSGRLSRRAKVPFGPFLITAFLIVSIFGDWFLDSFYPYLGL
jgi:prepilin signal peptidase PulO-like enzyme (type II secretory pathway)